MDPARFVQIAQMTSAMMKAEMIISPRLKVLNGSSHGIQQPLQIGGGAGG